MKNIKLITIHMAHFSCVQEQRESWRGRTVCKSQNYCYQFMIKIFWNSMMQRFKPRRTISFNQLDIQSTDRVLLVGEEKIEESTI